MTAIQQCKEAWEDLSIGRFVTTTELRSLANLEVSERSRRTTSRFLCTMYSESYARRRRDGTEAVYEKVKFSCLPESIPPKPNILMEKQFTMVELGEVVFELIQKLKKDIIRLNTQLKEEQTLMKEVVDEKVQIQRVLRDAQTKILELNNSSQKSFRMSDVQRFRDELPEGQNTTK